MTKIILKIIGMHCTSCSVLIDTVLEELPGVISAQTSYADQNSVVEYDERKIQLPKIIETIKKEGYQAKL